MSLIQVKDGVIVNTEYIRQIDYDHDNKPYILMEGNEDPITVDSFKVEDLFNMINNDHGFINGKFHLPEDPLDAIASSLDNISLDLQDLKAKQAA